MKVLGINSYWPVPSIDRRGNGPFEGYYQSEYYLSSTLGSWTVRDTMENPTPTKMRQIRVGIHLDGFNSTENSAATDMARTEEHSLFQSNLLSKCPAHLWPKESYRMACPRPILVTRHHREQIVKLSKALTVALSDIVSRWWSDKQARFFERMPLKLEEENILKVG